MKSCNEAGLFKCLTKITLHERRKITLYKLQKYLNSVIFCCIFLDMEGFLNSLISLMFSMTEKRDDVICTFVKCLVDMENHPALRHRVYVMEIYHFYSMS